MKRDIRIFIEDILESIKKIRQYTQSITKQGFLEESQVQDAVLRRLEIIGEAAKTSPKTLEKNILKFLGRKSPV